jgi:general secretion pathway protein D
VTYDKASDIGLDGSISRKFDFGSQINNAVNLTNAFSGAALGNNSLPIGSGGFYQILGNDWQVTLRAIAEAGKTEVLSRPSIMARNNQQAIIMVGQRIPIITGSQTIPLTGGINNTISYENVGIILRVTPFISSDGLVEMIVAPEISSLANQGVSISTGTTGSYNAPVINSRSAETVVVTPDGTTVVIGGLMANAKVENVRKIPIIADIPLVGKLFQRKTINSTKTELMIFLTPHIINLPSQVAAFTASERAKSVLTRKAFTDQEVDKFIDGLPVKSDNATDATKKPSPPATKKAK